MSSRIYGQSDDLIEFESTNKGELTGEVGCFGTDDRKHGVLVVCDDGTVLEVKYGKGGLGIWEVKLLRAGALFERIDPCTDEDAAVYSDVAVFRDGMKGAWAATDGWERVS